MSEGVEGPGIASASISEEGKMEGYSTCENRRSPGMLVDWVGENKDDYRPYMEQKAVIYVFTRKALNRRIRNREWIAERVSLDPLDRAAGTPIDPRDLPLVVGHVYARLEDAVYDLGRTTMEKLREILVDFHPLSRTVMAPVRTVHGFDTVTSSLVFRVLNLDGEWVVETVQVSRHHLAAWRQRLDP